MNNNIDDLLEKIELISNDINLLYNFLDGIHKIDSPHLSHLSHIFIQQINRLQQIKSDLQYDIQEIYHHLFMF